MTSGKVVTTIGYERRTNPTLLIEEESLFVEFMAAEQPPRPANMLNIVGINRGIRPYSWDDVVIPCLSVDEFQKQLSLGLPVIDTRDYPEYAPRHVPGSINVPLSSSLFEQSVGWIAPEDSDFLLVSEEEGDGEAISRKLAFVGLDQRARGVVTMQAWAAAEQERASFDLLHPREVHERVQRSEMQILDVRDPGERQNVWVEGSAYMKFQYLDAMSSEIGLDASLPVAVLCAGGLRASTACGILRKLGYRPVNVDGGLNAWIAADLPVLRGQ